jgi:hypothetical protein
MGKAGHGYAMTVMTINEMGREMMVGVSSTKSSTF